MTLTRLAMLAAVSTLALACTDTMSTGAVDNSTMGTVVVKLTDAPFPTDQVKSVDIFVIRVDARIGSATDADADRDLDNSTSSGWRTLASPNASYDLLALQNGASATLGTAALTAGTYNGFRFVIDPTKSSVTLKTGQKLTIPKL